MEDADSCVWHADPDEVSKSVEVLQEARAPPDDEEVPDINPDINDEDVSDLRKITSPMNELLDGAKLSGVELGDEITFERVALCESDFSDANLKGADLKGADLRNANLRGADLRKAYLKVADLRNANLRRANLRKAYLVVADLRNASLADSSSLGLIYISDWVPVDYGWRRLFLRTDLSDAYLSRAKLSGATLGGTDLSGADLRNADLSDASFYMADLSGADLREADLSNAELRMAVLAGIVLGDTTMSTAKLNHRTKFTSLTLRLRFKSIFGPRFRKLNFSTDAWNAHARNARTLATICSEKGLIRQARTLTIWERNARRYAALLELRILTAFGSWLNWQATGYGISVSRVSRNMLFLFLASTLTYLLYGINTADEAIPFSDLVSRPVLTDFVVNTVYFSVVTFTTSPPGPVSVEVSQWMAMVETFLGTLLIVLLGYVLGHREQI